MTGLGNYAVELPKSPSEYWASNCYNGGSFLTPWESDMRHGVGVTNLLWGSDYPHTEGTWPNTRLAMRHAFSGLPESDTRLILGENAVVAYGLDVDALRTIASRIGPTPQDLSEPLVPQETSAIHSLAFRAAGHWET